MLADESGPEEWISGSDGIDAAVINATYPRAVERRFEGTSDLRCKIQLAGKSRYCFDGESAESPSRPLILYAYKPLGSHKFEHVEAGVFERSITLVFPVGQDSLGGCERDDVCVDKALHQMGAQLLARNCALPGTIARLVASILDVDRTARKFEKLRRCRVDELACLTLDLFLDTFREPARSRVTARDRRQVFDARELLIANLCTAPSLSALASSVGTNRTKLNGGFRAVFGMSPYQLLHTERMRVARELLEQGQLTVTDVASQCGYDHVSNFSLAFKAFYGLAPSALRGDSNC